VKQVTSGPFSSRQGIGNGLPISGLVTARLRQGQAMGQRLRSFRSGDWRSGDGEKLWLSLLVETMEEVSRPEFREIPCAPSILIDVEAQLARSASPCPYGASNFSLRN